MASSLSDILATIQNGVIALNNMAVQVKGSFTAILSRFVTDETNIATNTTNITTNTTNIATNTAAISVLQALLAKVTNSLGGDVALNNIANYFDGPSVAQGVTGTWFASGTVTVADTAGAAVIHCKLWDGTTVIASTLVTISATSSGDPVSLSGYIASPVANIRISCKDVTSASGKIVFNATGNSKDSTLSAIRIA